MKQLSSTELAILYPYIPDDSRYTTLRGMIKLHEEGTVPIEQVLALPVFQQFVQTYKEDIRTILTYTTQEKREKENAIYTHNEHYLERIFCYLEHTAYEEQSDAYIHVTLKAYSGAIESPMQMNLEDIHMFIEELTQNTPIDSDGKIINIAKYLKEKGLFSTEKEYRVRVALSSERMIKLMILHTSGRCIYFALSDNKKDIITMIQNVGYTDTGTIEGAIEPI